jgi:2-C-methyl-D-erythritol 2,4-cyclodiphosphate synthase
MRFGHGYDVHRFTPGDHIVLAGIKIPHAYSLLAHSDGDVLIHAVCDALLGAAALGDIGEYFSDQDSKWKNISSMVLLKEVQRMLKDKNYSITNIDITVVAESPKLSVYKKAMRENLAKAMNMDINTLNIKATTTEGLGFTGRSEGIAVFAVCGLSLL